MAVINKHRLYKNGCKFKSKYKRTGFNVWRFFCSGHNNTTGENKVLYLELSILNPAVSPNKTQFAFKSNDDLSSAELQDFFPKNPAVQKKEKNKISSYIRVRACILGTQPYQIDNYFPASAAGSLSKAFDFHIGDCLFSETVLRGRVAITQSDFLHHPEYMSDSGLISWKLYYDMTVSTKKKYSVKKFLWKPFALAGRMEGYFAVNGTEYQVKSQNSFGYIDFLSGIKRPVPWFCLSSSNLISIISGKKLQRSCFVVQGINNNHVSILVNFEGTEIFFPLNSGKKKYSTWDCVQVPDDPSDKRLHWSVSVHNKTFVIDIDVFADSSELCMCYDELPVNNSFLIKTLTGGTATGEIRLYKQIKKSLELIEHAHIANSICEYGLCEKNGK